MTNDGAGFIYTGKLSTSIFRSMEYFSRAANLHLPSVSTSKSGTFFSGFSVALCDH